MAVKRRGGGWAGWERVVAREGGKERDGA